MFLDNLDDFVKCGNVFKREYEFFENGSVNITLSGKVRENCVRLPRLGFEFKAIKENDSFVYYGKGPHELMRRHRQTERRLK